jgi:hypothetical protein
MGVCKKFYILKKETQLKKFYIALTMLAFAALTKSEDNQPNPEGKRKVGGFGLEKSTFFYAKDLSASNVAASSGTTLTAAGYYLLSGPVTTSGTGVALTISGNNITVDLDGNSIAFGGSSTKAIHINSTAKNVTIKNGTISGAFTTGAISVGHSTSNILLENITIDGPAGYGIAATGTAVTGATIRGLTLRNVTVSKCTKTGAALYPIDIDYAQGVTLENIVSLGAATSTSGLLSGIRILNSNSITGKDIVSTNHAGIDGTIGLQLTSCENVTLHGVNVSNNDDSNPTFSSGLVLNGCKNVLIQNLSADNLTNTLNNVSITSSNNVTIENASASNSTGTGLTSVIIVASKSLLLRNFTVANNTTSLSSPYTGLSTSASCESIRLENVAIQGNVSDNLLIGISLGVTTGIEIVDCQVNYNIMTNDISSTDARGLHAVDRVTNLTIRNSQFNANSRTAAPLVLGGIVAGVYLDGVIGCEIYNSQANRNNGTGRAYGFYIANTDGLIMNGCTANRNAAAVLHSSGMGSDINAQEGTQNAGNADGIESVPSAGLYLLTSDYAEVTDCKFINNRSGNYAPGVAAATPSATTSCSAHGVANIGTYTNPTVNNFNTGNTFTRCIFQGNNTQLLNVAPVEPAPMGGAYNNGNHWINEAFAAGATEEFTSGTVYNNCQFNANGNACKWAAGFGLCVFTGCNTLYINNCTASTNGWYGFYDSTSAHIIALTGCVSSMNGVGNSQATTAIPSANMRNYSLGGGVTPYKSVTVADFSQIAPTGSAYLNLSVTP